MPDAAELRAALQRVVAAGHAILEGLPPPPLTEEDLLTCECALRAAGLLAERSGSEAVKLMLVRALVEQGIAFATEYRLPARADAARGKWFRADLVLLRELTPILAVECKGYDRQLGGTRQRQNYARCGTPAMHVGPQTVSQAITAIVAFVSDGTPPPAVLLVTDIFPMGGGGGMHFPERSEGGNGVDVEVQKQKKHPDFHTSIRENKEKSRAREDKTTWLTPYYEAYRAAYGAPPESVAIGRMARVFKALEFNTPREEVARRFAIYLANTPPRFYSVEHFAETFAGWSTAPVRKADGLDPLPGEDVDAYIRRLALYPPR